MILYHFDCTYQHMHAASMEKFKYTNSRNFHKKLNIYWDYSSTQQTGTGIMLTFMIPSPKFKENDWHSRAICQTVDRMWSIFEPQNRKNEKDRVIGTYLSFPLMLLRAIDWVACKIPTGIIWCNLYVVLLSSV